MEHIKSACGLAIFVLRGAYYLPGEVTPKFIRPKVFVRVSPGSISLLVGKQEITILGQSVYNRNAKEMIRLLRVRAFHESSISGLGSPIYRSVSDPCGMYSSPLLNCGLPVNSLWCIDIIDVAGPISRYHFCLGRRVYFQHTKIGQEAVFKSTQGTESGRTKVQIG